MNVKIVILPAVLYASEMYSLIALRHIECLTFGFHEMLGNYRVAYHLVASRVVLSSIGLVS
jgi:hypothetical protein